MKIRFKNLFLSLLTITFLFGIFGCKTEPDYPNSEREKVITVTVDNFVPGKTSVEQAQNMGMGWNLGNTLDATATWTKDTETAWGMPKTTQAMIKAVRAAGFKTIRIPVSWHDHVSTTNYTVDTTWMSRVKTIVDWSIAEGMCVIINIHHDNLAISKISKQPGFAISTDKEIQTKSKEFLEKVWTQIATTFADYDDNLVFEVLNEPRDVDGEFAGNEWWTNNSSIFSTITAYEQVCVNAIRKTGGKNATRYIMVPGYAASGSDSGMLRMYKMPTDTAEDKLILSAHAYSPYAFAMSDTKDTVFGADDKSSLDSIFAFLKSNYTDKGIGVVMGEASATDKNNLAERIKWTQYYFQKAKDAKIPVIIWDNMVTVATGGDITSGECHGYFNRRNGKWYFPSIIKEMIKVVYGDILPPEEEISDSENSNEDGNLLLEPLDLISWNVNTTIPSVSFANASNSSKLTFTFEPSSLDNPKYKNVKLQDTSWKFVFSKGAVSGNATAGDNVIEIASESGVFSYTPTADEWKTIKSTVLIVYGYGVKISKIVLE